MSVVAIFAVVLGAVVAVYGFLAMLDPMKLSVSSWTDGYYQRLVLDRDQRFALRLVAVFVSFFGLTFGTAALSTIMGRAVLLKLSTNFLVTMALLFVFGFLTGILLLIRDAIQGKPMIVWWNIWNRGAQLSVISVSPRFTPAMLRERKWFMGGYSLMVAACLLSMWS